MRDSNPEPAEKRRRVLASSTPTAYLPHDLPKCLRVLWCSDGDRPHVRGDGRGVNRGVAAHPSMSHPSGGGTRRVTHRRGCGSSRNNAIRVHKPAR